MIKISSNKIKTKYDEICELARVSHLKYAITKINQAIILIHKDARKIRFNYTNHLHKMLVRQSEHRIHKSRLKMKTLVKNMYARW